LNTLIKTGRKPSMITSKYTGMIKIKGWKVLEVLAYWGRSYDWYHRQCKGGGKAALRLECMIRGLEEK